ncbi:NAD(P)-binding protein [Aaosphaeria arxii CBS 175.79]|uniref:NAD(P)-binding protein n=1 Tax=Aaosphaeria arxii CBS 175.79 TaxID=1450172 RepID=A0A6A5X6Z4_9PLEO|nr:NAD(P)-binding protein [Aaosphaeria arxii CBS 175.79]KAF2008785.1 NAD(P)-binding protein [Aaosphaeria arxii CBS 175.79]
MTIETQSLKGKVAVVSGSSLGLGAAIVRELSRRGASVAINYPYPDEKANAERVVESLGPDSKSVIIEADMSTETGPRFLADRAAEAFGKIDILINCAGINRMMSLDDPDERKVQTAWDLIARTNARGTFMLTRATLKHLAREGSRIINIGSGVSRAADPHSSIYAGSKGMIESYTQCWAMELPRKYGCTVNGIAPGIVETETFLAAPKELRDSLQPKIDVTPVAPRAARPEEVAWVVATLCEKEAGWLNGLYLPVSGGLFMF